MTDRSISDTDYLVHRGHPSQLRDYFSLAKGTSPERSDLDSPRLPRPRPQIFSDHGGINLDSSKHTLRSTQYGVVQCTPCTGQYLSISPAAWLHRSVTLTLSSRQLDNFHSCCQQFAARLLVYAENRSRFRVYQGTCLCCCHLVCWTVICNVTGTI